MNTQYSIIHHPNSNNSIRRGRRLPGDRAPHQIVKSGHNPVELEHVPSKAVLRASRSKYEKPH